MLEKSATLEQIAKANNKLSGDELLQCRKEKEEEERKQFDNKAGRYFNRRERRILRKMLLTK